MRKILVFLIITISFLAFAREPNITLSLSKNKCSIGDKVYVDLKVVTDKGAKVDFTLNTLKDEKIVLNGFKKGVKDLPEGMSLKTFSFYIQPFKLGKVKAGEIVVEVNDKRFVKTIPELEVVSILPKNKKDINPLKPQGEIKPDYSYLKRMFLYALVVFLILLALFFLLRKLYRKFKGIEKKEKEKPVVLDPPCIEVKNMLSKLLSSTLLKEGRVKEFFVELSEIAKRFLGRVFEFDYDSKTSEEVMFLLKGKVNMDEESLIKDFFNVSDLVKFAKYIPEQSEINSTVNTLYQLVDKICERVETEMMEKKEEGESNVQV